VRDWGSPNSDDWRKGSALCLLYGFGGGTRLREWGWGSQFGRGDRHYGTLGIYVLCALCLFLKAWLKAGLAVRTEYLRWKFRNNEKVKRRN
jgi:hypothetical protein